MDIHGPLQTRGETRCNFESLRLFGNVLQVGIATLVSSSNDLTQPFAYSTLLLDRRQMDPMINWFLPSLQVIAAAINYVVMPVSTWTRAMSQYGISQLMSHQYSRILADCFPLSWRHQNMLATLVTGANLHEVLSKFSQDLPIPASQANS